MRAIRITTRNGLPFEDIEILDQQAPELINDVFNNKALIFRNKDGIFFTNKNNITLIEVRKQRNIPSQAVKLCRVSIVDDMTFSPIWVIRNCDKGLCNIPDIFGEDQLTFIADKRLFISLEDNISLIQCGHK